MQLKNLGCLLAVMLTAITALAAPASAQDFCNGAATPTDGAICESPKLSALNTEIADLYALAINRAYSDGGPAEAIKRQQSAWIRSLQECNGDAGCIEDSMASRKSVLQATLPAPEAASSAQATEEPEAAADPESVAADLAQIEVDPLESEQPLPTEVSQGGPLDNVRGGLKWLLYLTVVTAFFFGISIVTRTLKVAKLQYGHDLVFNKAGFASIGSAVLLVWGLFTGGGALILWPIAFLCLLVALSYNVRRTTFGIGLVGTIVQPFILIISAAGLYWLFNASRRIATGDHRGL